jgi:SAM-dependent methyltransferase
MAPTADPRSRWFWELHDLGQGRGLEIGPLHRPTALPGEADVRFADVFSTERLREMYAADEKVPTEDIPDIDYVLLSGDHVQRLEDVAAPGAPFDWVVACHVVEHVPDLIEWLRQIAELTADDGVLLLAVPDRRYSFDLHRPLTSVGQVLEAHERGDTRPSTRAVYDHFRSHVAVGAHPLWEGEPPPGLEARSYALDEVLDRVTRAAEGEYVDAHVWTFTPDSFVTQLAELRTLGRSAWFVEEVRATPRNALEFLVKLRRVPRGSDSTAPIEGELGASQAAPEWVGEQQAARAQVLRLRRRVQRLRSRVEAMESSRRWRVGGAVVAPARPLARLVRRRSR